MKKSFLYKLKLKAEIVTAALIGARSDCEVLDADDLFAVQYQRHWLDKSLSTFYIDLDYIVTSNLIIRARVFSDSDETLWMHYADTSWKLEGAGRDCMTRPGNWIFHESCKTNTGIDIMFRRYYLHGLEHRVAIWDRNNIWGSN